MPVKRRGMLGVSVRKIKALTVKMTVTLIDKGKIHCDMLYVLSV
jgi:hypothetical protein